MNLDPVKKLMYEQDFKGAEKILQKGLKTEKDKFMIFYFLGLVHFELRNLDKSIQFFEKSINLRPNNISAYLKLAVLYQTMGDTESSKNNYLKSIELDTNQIRSYYGLYQLKPKFLKDEYYDKIRNISLTTKENSIDLAISKFLLSKFEISKKNLKKELTLLEDAHKTIFNANLEYNRESDFYYKKIMQKFHNKIEFSNLDNSVKQKYTKPIFIIGLPRTGSTLIESIISSDNNNYLSFGESSFFHMGILEQIKKKNLFNNDNYYNVNNIELNLKELKDYLFKRYSQFNSSKNENEKEIIDKSLDNFFNIETILRVFPDAKIINSTRNIYDNIIAIYEKLLAKLSWAHTIKDILDYIDIYLGIMDYYQKKYPKNIIKISLESLNNDKYIETKKIFEFCDLNWNEEIFEFHKRDDLYIKTSSNVQLRTGIQSYDYNKYKRYYSLFEDYKKNYEWLNN